MKSDYSRDIFKQLEETMKRLDKMESTLENTRIEHKIEIGHLNDKIDSLEKENAALKIENTKLKDDNERLRRIINNDSTNSTLPPSSDEKPAKAANEFNHSRVFVENKFTADNFYNAYMYYLSVSIRDTL